MSFLSFFGQNFKIGYLLPKHTYIYIHIEILVFDTHDPIIHNIVFAQAKRSKDNQERCKEALNQLEAQLADLH